MLKIIKIPNEVLTTPTKLVPKIDGKIIKLVHDMEETLLAQINPQGVGLAAPQVGISLSLFIIKARLKSDTDVFINPTVLEVKDSKPQPEVAAKESTKLEGCLSIPRIWAPVLRSPKVHLEYMDIDGRPQREWFTGFKAVIIQHEVDHLSGVLFTRRAVEQGTQLYEEKGGELKKVAV